mmetsp:Transcript_62478/g.92862  ORF Transcript_62478/g.92862 Transcript_62478/m.92862 type:complete len:1437 (+) Transcript_62478:312-4622(+)
MAQSASPPSSYPITATYTTPQTTPSPPHPHRTLSHDPQPQTPLTTLTSPISSSPQSSMPSSMFTPSKMEIYAQRDEIMTVSSLGSNTSYLPLANYNAQQQLLKAKRNVEEEEEKGYLAEGDNSKLGRKLESHFHRNLPPRHPGMTSANDGVNHPAVPDLGLGPSIQIPGDEESPYAPTSSDDDNFQKPLLTPLMGNTKRIIQQEPSPLLEDEDFEDSTRSDSQTDSDGWTSSSSYTSSYYTEMTGTSPGDNNTEELDKKMDHLMAHFERIKQFQENGGDVVDRVLGREEEIKVDFEPNRNTTVSSLGSGEEKEQPKEEWKKTSFAEMALRAKAMAAERRKSLGHQEKVQKEEEKEKKAEKLVKVKVHQESVTLKVPQDSFAHLASRATAMAAERRASIVQDQQQQKQQEEEERKNKEESNKDNLKEKTVDDPRDSILKRIKEASASAAAAMENIQKARMQERDMMSKLSSVNSEWNDEGSFEPDSLGSSSEDHSGESMSEYTEYTDEYTEYTEGIKSAAPLGAVPMKSSSSQPTSEKPIFQPPFINPAIENKDEDDSVVALMKAELGDVPSLAPKETSRRFSLKRNASPSNSTCQVEEDNCKRIMTCKGPQDSSDKNTQITATGANFFTTKEFGAISIVSNEDHCDTTPTRETKADSGQNHQRLVTPFPSSAPFSSGPVASKEKEVEYEVDRKRLMEERLWSNYLTATSPRITPLAASFFAENNAEEKKDMVIDVNDKDEVYSISALTCTTRFGGSTKDGGIGGENGENNEERKIGYGHDAVKKDDLATIGFRRMSGLMEDDEGEKMTVQNESIRTSKDENCLLRPSPAFEEKSNATSIKREEESVITPIEQKQEESEQDFTTPIKKSDSAIDVLRDLNNNSKNISSHSLNQKEKNKEVTTSEELLKETTKMSSIFNNKASSVEEMEAKLLALGTWKSSEENQEDGIAQQVEYSFDQVSYGASNISNGNTAQELLGERSNVFMTPDSLMKFESGRWSKDDSLISDESESQKGDVVDNNARVLPSGRIGWTDGVIDDDDDDDCSESEVSPPKEPEDDPNEKEKSNDDHKEDHNNDCAEQEDDQKQRSDKRHTERLERNIVELTLQLANARTQLDIKNMLALRLSEERYHVTSELERVNLENRQLSKRNTGLVYEHERLKTKMEIDVKATTRLRDENSTLHDRCQELETRIKELESTTNTQRMVIDDLRSNAEKCALDRRTSAERIIELQNERENNCTSLHKTNTALRKAESKADGLEHSNAKLEVTVRKLNSDLNHNQSLINSLTKDRDGLRRDVRNLIRENNELQVGLEGAGGAAGGGWFSGGKTRESAIVEEDEQDKDLQDQCNPESRHSPMVLTEDDRGAATGELASEWRRRGLRETSLVEEGVGGWGSLLLNPCKRGFLGIANRTDLARIKKTRSARLRALAATNKNFKDSNM